MSATHHRLASILFSDMVGYSAMAQKDEALAIELLHEHRRLLREAFERHGGREIDAVGDGFFVEFSSALDATRCARTIQERLHQRNTQQTEQRRISVRIGIHLGDVAVEDERVLGDGVNIAARIQALAGAGEIWVSAEVAKQLANKPDFELEPLGARVLKNISNPVEIYRIRLPWQDPHLTPERSASAKPSRRRMLFILAPLGLAAVFALSVPAWRRLTAVQGTGSGSTPRLAVLPFDNLSADPSNEYFVDGMTEELISRLSRLRGLEVIARTSVMQYKGKPKSIAEVGKALAVDHILEGSVRRSGDKLRITAQLIDVQSQAHRWSDDFDREVKDVFAIQTEVAQQVAQALQAKLLAADHAALQRGGTANVAAYDLYLQGLNHQSKQSPEGLTASLAYFTRATEVDPRYAQAYAAKSISLELQGEFYYQPAKDVFPLARVAAEKALDVDPESVDALLVLAAMKVYLDLDWAGSKALYERALTLNPNSANAHDWYGILYLAPQGEVERAIEHLQRAVSLDPLFTLFLFDLGATYHVKRDFATAIQYYSRALDRESNATWVRYNRSLAYGAQGEHERAINDTKLIVEQERTPHNLSALIWAYAMAGRKNEAQALLRELDRLAQHPQVSPASLAMAYVGLGQHDTAIALLEQTFERKEYRHLLFLGTGPQYDPLRNHPRFEALVDRMGLRRRN